MQQQRPQHQRSSFNQHERWRQDDRKGGSSGIASAIRAVRVPYQCRGCGYQRGSERVHLAFSRSDRGNEGRTHHWHKGGTIKRVEKMGRCSCLGSPSTAPRKPVDTPQKLRREQEREAEEFAAYLLMPEEELQKLGDLQVWELAKYFGVPEKMVELRLALSDADKQQESDW